MAKQDGVIQFTGKLGQTVGAKGQDGRNVLRVRRNTIKNPKTDAQCAQRMICTTAAQAVSQLKQILNNSFEGKSFGAKSLQHARSLYMRMLRTVPSLDGNGMVYLPKGSLKFPINRYQLSEGTLPDPGISYDPMLGFVILGNFTEAQMTSLTASQVFSAVAVGNQITFVGAWAGNSYNTTRYCRFAFKNDTTPIFVGSDGDYYLNPAAIDLTLAEGPWKKVKFGIDTERNSIVIDLQLLETTTESPQGWGVIISNKAAGKRSTAYLEFETSEDPEVAIDRGGVAAAIALPTYGDNAASLNLPSDYYLQNSLTPEAGE